MSKGLFAGMVIGFVAGAVTAIFLTTKTGEELREEIKEMTLDVKAKVEERAQKVKNLSRARYAEIVDSVLASYNKVKGITEREIDSIKKIVIEQKEVIS